jgi:cytochrome c-type biogenesis protein CcmH
VVPRSDVEKRLGQRLVCLCGDCGKEPIGVCACDYAKNIRRQIATLVDEGKTEDQILQHFIAQYGSQELLGAPLDQGFNRLAWLFPYLAAAGGAVAIGFAAVRWSRRSSSATAEAPLAVDNEMTERLDDELRNLD